MPRLFVNGLSLVAALLFAPLAAGEALTTHQNQGGVYYYHGKKLPHHYQRYRYQAPPRDYGYHYDEGYSRDYCCDRSPVYRSYGGHEGSGGYGYQKPPYYYHGRAYYPYYGAAFPSQDPGHSQQDRRYDGHGQGYNDGYHDGVGGPHNGSKGVFYLYHGARR